MVAKVVQPPIPSDFSLSQNETNPFDSTTTIVLGLPHLSDWSMKIFDVNGKLMDSYRGRTIGTVVVEWDASSAPAGVYICQAIAGSFTDTIRMELRKTK